MKLAVAISGASGAIYAHRLLHYLEQQDVVDKIGVVFSPNAIEIYKQELGFDFVPGAKCCVYHHHDFGAPFASGSCDYDGMVVCPCSMGTLGRIASGISDSLITRAADVMLKERRPLILVLRETPYSLIHIKNMESVTLSGGIVMPACPNFYSAPKTITELVDTVVFRIQSQLHIPNNGYKWGS